MGAQLSAVLATGRLELPCCSSCGAIQYPPAEICRQCLAGVVELAPADPNGSVIASAAVHRSYAMDFADGGPWFVASIKLAAGPIVFAHVLELLDGGTVVMLVALTDGLGDGVLGAVREAGEQGALQARFNRLR